MKRRRGKRSGDERREKPRYKPSEEKKNVRKREGTGRKSGVRKVGQRYVDSMDETAAVGAKG